MEKDLHVEKYFIRLIASKNNGASFITIQKNGTGLIKNISQQRASAAFFLSCRLTSPVHVFNWLSLNTARTPRPSSFHSAFSYQLFHGERTEPFSYIIRPPFLNTI